MELQMEPQMYQIRQTKTNRYLCVCPNLLLGIDPETWVSDTTKDAYALMIETAEHINRAHISEQDIEFIPWDENAVI